MNRRDLIGLVVGSVIAWPGPANGQPVTRQYRIAYLALSPLENTTHMKPFVERLAELGLVAGQNLDIAYRCAEGRPEHLRPLATELVQLKPDVLVAGFGTLAARAAKEATTTIPVVFLIVGDPVGAGLVTSLARPGGNVTGMSSQVTDIGGKRLQLVREIAPGAKRIAVLMNPQTPYTALALKELRSAALPSGLELGVFEVTAAGQLPQQFEAAVKVGAAVAVVLEDPLMFGLRPQLAELSLKHRMPALFGDRAFVEDGGLMAYGPDRPAIFRRAADYVDKVLKGATPGELPVEQPTKFELVVNLKAAKALGLAVPQSLLLRADEVIQ